MFRKLLGLEVLAAVVLGVFTGIFLGPLANVFKPIGDAFVMLLQMVVLPYICFSIIHGLGSINRSTALILLKKGWHIWVLLWGAMFLTIYLFYLLIPKARSGSFIPTDYSSVQPSLTENIMSYIIPENPIYDLANNIVPAVAIFGVIAGLALMHLDKKEPLLGFLEGANQMIERILRWIANISPIGVFAHLAVVTGTAYFYDLSKIEFYVICFIMISLFLTFIILPLLLCTLTPMKYRESISAFRSVCLLSFVTGLPTIAIPFINMYLRRFEDKYQLKEQNFRTTSQTIMPLGYSFAQIGNALLLFFILFISFYYRQPFSFVEKTALSFLTIPLSIGSSSLSINAVSFVIEQLGFPSEAVELFSQTMAVTLNFQVLLSVASVLTFSILVLHSYYQMLQVRIKPLLIKGIGAFAVLTLLILLVKPMVKLHDNYRDLYMGLSIQTAVENPVKATIYTQGDSIPERSSGEDPLQTVLQSGILRVGYDPEVVPYVYYNNAKELAGYDIAMAYQLARDMDCKLEFIPITLDKLEEDLNGNLYDVAMSAIVMDEERIETIDFTHFYTEQNNVLIVPVKKQAEFQFYKKVVADKGLKIGATGAYKSVFRRHFPNATLVEGNLDVLASGEAEAWIWSHIPAFIWCLDYPQYSVIDYQGQMGKRYFAYATKQGAYKFTGFLNNWMGLQVQNGYTHRQYHYWILGIPPSEQVKERWSIIRNVLHWID